MKKELPEKEQDHKPPQRFEFLVAILCGALILAHFFSSFFPKARLWGINHLAYFPLWTRVVFTLLGLSILLPRVNSRVYRLLEQILSFLQRVFAKREIWGYVLGSILFMFLFWLLRTRTHFLGDGYAQISHLQSEQYLKTGFEPLEIFSHLYLFKFLKIFSSPSAEFIYVGLSILAGGLFIFILFFLTRDFSEDIFDRSFIFSLLLFSGATQLFLGYAEHYTLTYVSIFAYLYFCVRYLQEKAKIYLPIFFCALSISFHLSSAYLLPSLFFLSALKKKEGELFFSRGRAMLYLGILIILSGVFIFYIRNVNPVLLETFIPVFRGRYYAPGYTLFSFPHLLDMVNQHLLLSPAGIILLLGLVISCRNRIGFKSTLVLFLVIVSTVQLFYNFILDPKLGAGRDWDLFSHLTLGYTLLGGYLFTRVVEFKRYSGVILIFTVFLSSLPWFLLNANVATGIDRYKNLLDLDLKRSLTGRYTLADYYAQKKNLEEAQKVKNTIYRLFPEDSLARTAESHMETGNLDSAIALLEKAIVINPGFLKAYTDLGGIYLVQGEVDKAIQTFQALARVNPLSPAVHMNLGYALLNKGRLKEGLEELKLSAKLEADPEVYSNMGYVYLKLGDQKRAIEAYRKAIRIKPEFYVPHFWLGMIYLQRNSLDEALSELNQAVKLKPDFAPALYNLGGIYSQKGLKDKAIEQFELFLKYSQDEAQKDKVREWIAQLRSQSP